MRRRILQQVPPVLAGLVTAVAMETSVGLLLYADEGLLPALTLILTIELGALTLGLWSGSVATSHGWVEQIRRRWLFCLIVFAVAAAMSAGLDAAGDRAATGVGQGIGLGFLGGLPLFSLGALLGAMVRDREEAGLIPMGVGVPAVLGGAAGVFLAGTVLIPNAAPYSLYLFCLVILSGGALVHGWVLDGRPATVLLATAPGPAGELRVERRSLGAQRKELMVLLEGERVRGAEDRDGRPGRDWEAAVAHLVPEGDEDSGSILLLGGGSGTLARVLTERARGSRVEVVERTRALVTLARKYLREWEGWEEVETRFHDPLDGLERRGETFALVVVDAGVLPVLGGRPFLRRGDWEGLAALIQPKGSLILGGMGLPAGSAMSELEAFLEALMKTGAPWTGSVKIYRREGNPGQEDLLGEQTGAGGLLLVISGEEAPGPPDTLPGFRRQEV